VSLPFATTLARRFVTKFGEPYATPFPDLARLTPTPERITEGGHRREEQARRRLGEAGGGALAAVAPVAQLRGAAPLARGRRCAAGR
jgi:AraC family transcriptional regulator of adaptative response / DNA-3-methyladenine glycosylase II